MVFTSRPRLEGLKAGTTTKHLFPGARGGPADLLGPQRLPDYGPLGEHHQRFLPA